VLRICLLIPEEECVWRRFVFDLGRNASLKMFFAPLETLEYLEISKSVHFMNVPGAHATKWMTISTVVL
jgi:hypothetical protein